MLRRAMRMSGFDEALRGLAGTDMLYGGYSAGVCVLGPTLRGLDLVDDPTVNPYGEKADTIYDGLGILEYVIVPHYRSDHPESKAVENVVACMDREKIPYRTLRDGEVLVIE